MKSLDKLVIQHGFQGTTHGAYLEVRGLPKADTLWGSKRGFRLSEEIADINNDQQGAVKTVTMKEQLKYLERFVRKPLGSFRCMCISSQPSDLRAKHLAMWMFDKAVQAYNDNGRMRGAHARTAPLWHRVFGGFHDELMESRSERPALLVISNVLEDSTSTKIEKVRDLLEKYNDTPRIVVTGGTDPLQLFRSRLCYPVDAAIYLDVTGRNAGPDVL